MSESPPEDRAEQSRAWREDPESPPDEPVELGGEAEEADTWEQSIAVPEDDEEPAG